MLHINLIHQPCLLCLAPTSACICSACRNACDRQTFTCYQCGLPTGVATPACGDCLQQPKPFVKTVCAFSYTAPVAYLVHLFKERLPAELLDEFVAELLPTLRSSYADTAWPQMLVPVPSHWRKRLARGYNPAACLASALAETLQLRAVNALTAATHTPAQKSLKRKARFANLAGAFKINSSTSEILRGKHLALIDDVITTGATVTLLSKLLLAAGAARVDVWAIARTPRPGDL